jgi:hypothetical protein
MRGYGARIDLYNSRSHAIDAQSPPDVGRLRVVVRQLVPVLRHRQHPHGAERGNHRDIHDDPHGPIPWFTQWENCRLPGRSSGKPWGPLEALPGRAMTATERTQKRHRKHGLEAKAEEFSAFAAHSWASGTRDWN